MQQNLQLNVGIYQGCQVSENDKSETLVSWWVQKNVAFF